jgi:prophage regulatory protein
MEKQIFTLNELANYTGWSKSWIYKKTSDNTLKFSKPLGKTIFFSKAWIDEFLLSNPNTTATETESKAVHYVTLKKVAKC